MNALGTLNENYKSPCKKNWKGRATSSESGSQYWYQEIEIIDVEIFRNGWKNYQKPDVTLLGYACDEGVRRNFGRVGAGNGSIRLRQQLAKIPFHHMNKKVADLGDIICQAKELEDCHIALEEMVAQIILAGVFPILVGGGHDLAYAHFNGIRKALRNNQKSKIGIINFDAHFDLRPVEKEANSGTPFYQILQEDNAGLVDYFVLGIQEQSNTKELFEIANDFGVKYLLNYECITLNLESVKKRLSQFIKQNDYLYITIDMDGFSSAYAPGVSAPSPMGFTPYFVLEILKYLLASKKVISCDIAELNPNFDRDNLTANLAARLVDFIVANY